MSQLSKMLENITSNLKKVHDEINSCLQRAERSQNDLTLLCVSKTKPISQIIEAYNAGERHFGESYISEAKDKIPQLKEMGYKDIVWHFIGPIQSNKTKHIAELFDIVESVDRLKIAKRLNDQRPEDLPPLKILIQVNISDEEQKSGCSYADLDKLINEIKNLPRLELCGLMGVAEDTDDKEVIDKSFAKLHETFNSLKQNLPHFAILSIGMTHDMDLAIKEGSTEIRIGTAIFGARNYGKL